MIGFGETAGNPFKIWLFCCLLSNKWSMENHVRPPSLPTKTRDRVTYPVESGFIHWNIWTFHVGSLAFSEALRFRSAESLQRSCFLCPRCGRLARPNALLLRFRGWSFLLFHVVVPWIFWMVDGWWLNFSRTFLRMEDWKLRDLCDFCWQHFVHIPEKKWVIWRFGSNSCFVLPKTQRFGFAMIATTMQPGLNFLGKEAASTVGIWNPFLGSEDRN